MDFACGSARVLSATRRRYEPTYLFPLTKPESLFAVIQARVEVVSSCEYLSDGQVLIHSHQILSSSTSFIMASPFLLKELTALSVEQGYNESLVVLLSCRVRWAAIILDNVGESLARSPAHLGARRRSCEQLLGTSNLQLFSGARKRY
jgi:hypothetical protein